MESLIGIAIAAISAGGGVIAKALVDGWKEARRGRKDEAQRIADQRDQARTDYEQEKTCRLEWRDYAFQVRAVALRHDVPPDDLPDKPE